MIQLPGNRANLSILISLLVFILFTPNSSRYPSYAYENPVAFIYYRYNSFSDHSSDTRLGNPCDGAPMSKSVWLFEIKFKSPKPRTLCAVESLALQMPDWCVRLLVVNFRSSDSQNSLANSLQSSLPNVRISRLFPEPILKDTAFQNFSSGEPRKSYYFVPNLSDALRAVVLYKYGGIFVDTDMVAVRPLNPHVRNFFGRMVPAGIIGGPIMGSEHPFDPLFLKIINSSAPKFRPKRYASLMNALAGSVLQYCSDLGVEIYATDKRSPLVERCGKWYILGYNGTAMCTSYKMYENNRQKVKKQFQELSAENCSLVHWYQTFNSQFNRPINLTNEPELFFSKLAKRYCPLVANSVSLF